MSSAPFEPFVAGEVVTADQLNALRGECRNVVVVTDGSGRATIVFSAAFPSPPIVTTTGGNGEIVTIAPDGITADQVIVECRIAATAALITSGPARVLYQAFPAT
jgi:hypothetical protein